ncbi:hypothetical protein ACQ86O_15485 [Serratia sp. L9]|uniref:hypothetical protein n=1 Tax=Serratia sp. L9 TaxID=3423946 RepID=UPI003D66634C
MTLLLLIIGGLYWFLQDTLNLPPITLPMLIISAGIVWLVLMWLSPFIMHAWDRLARSRALQKIGRTAPESVAPTLMKGDETFTELKNHLRHRYGLFWKRKVRILMLVGQEQQVNAIAPGLVAQQWLEGEGTLLLWGGAATGEPEPAQLKALRKLRHRPLDGLVWVTDQYAHSAPIGQAAPAFSQIVPEADTMDTLARALVKRYQSLGWQVPLYVWALQSSPWDQSSRLTQPVGCLLPPQCQPEALAEQLSTLSPQLIALGTQQVLQDTRHDFLLSLADNLLRGGAEKLKASLAVLLSPYQPLPVAGVMFSLPLSAAQRTTPHSWGAITAGLRCWIRCCTCRWRYCLNAPVSLGKKPLAGVWPCCCCFGGRHAGVI